jgi:TolB-like protein
MTKLFAELKRRNVVRVGIAYIVLAWVALQVGDVLFDMFGTPDWVGKTLAVLLALGFPFACLFAWAFEVTPEGIKKTEEVDRSDSITHSTGRKLNAVIIVALVAALGYFIWERQGLVDSPGTDAEAADRSIAVLPFVNMSSDQEQEWFADGLTEEILNALARTPDLLVASRTSSFQFKGQNTDIGEIARKLGVAHVLEGSVRRGGERLRVTAQLIRASDGFHLWSETFDRAPEDVIAIQEDVAYEIARALDTAMDPDALKQMVSAGTASVAAYEAYLEGLALEGRTGATGNIMNWSEANEAFSRATDLDSNFAWAWWYQALYWESQLGITDIGSEISDSSTEEKFRLFTTAIDKAIENATGKGPVDFFRALKATNEFRWRDAIAHGEVHVRQYPNNLEGLAQLIEDYATIRDAEGVRPHLEQVLAIAHDDPLELNVVINNLLFVGLVNEAVDLARDVLRRFPEHMFLVYQSHRALLWGGYTEEAQRWADALGRSEFPAENLQLVALRQACAENDLDEAVRQAELLRMPGESDTSIEFLTRILLGDTQGAHEFLVEQKLDLHALNSFMNYPFFNHTYFPELAGILDRQGIERPFVEGPPYACRRSP